MSRIINTPLLGATFSHLHLLEKDISIDTAFTEYVSFGFTWIRLCRYWNEVEKKRAV